MIVWATLKPALLALFASLAGLPELAAGTGRDAPAAVWEDDARPFAAPAWALVSLLNLQPIGTADRTFEPVAAVPWAVGHAWGGTVPKLRQQASVHMLCTFRVKIETNAHTPAEDANTYAQTLLTRVELLENLLGFAELGLGFLSIGLTTRPTATYDQRIRSTHVIDLRFNVYNEATSQALYDRITRAEVIWT